MMKKAGSSKSISSPGRTDKFPPPLMRFLRSNVSSKSRRTKSPMLIMRNKNNSNTKLAIETTQEEPTSPKVTCIGQVRVARRSSNTGSRRRSISVRKQQQQQDSSSCCCCNLSIKLHYLMSSLRLALKKVVCCCCFQYGKKVEATNKVQSQHIRVSTSSSTTTAAGTESIENNNVAVVSGDNMNPPKDALILTRCRSAPYRSSSLASRFWGSPLNHHTSDSPESQSPQTYIQELEKEEEDVVKSSLPVLENSILPKSDEREEMKSSINEESSRDKEKNGEGGGTYVHPLLLTRCKSEPARTGERLNPRRFSELDSQS